MARKAGFTVRRGEKLAWEAIPDLDCVFLLVRTDPRLGMDPRRYTAAEAHGLTQPLSRLQRIFDIRIESLPSAPCLGRAAF